MKKKNLLLCLCLALTFSTASAFMTSCKDDSDNSSSSEQPVDYQEDGTYYNVADNTMEVVLNDGTYTLTLGGQTKTGVYTYDGETLVFVNEAGITNAKLVNGVLTFTYDGTVNTFYEKVNYTVTFSVNGTTTTASVLNGKYATAPANPEQSGKVFVGWYKDAGFTKQFSFATEAITTDITLYARFVDAQTEGTKFTVTYVVDGNVVGTAETINGSVYNLPVPEKEDATFVGWWKSDFYDANKLTAQVEAGATIVENTTLYAVWDSSAPKVSVTSTGVKWTAKGVNNQYRVKIYNPAGVVIANNMSTQATFAFDFASKAEGEYKVEVTVNGSDSTTVYFKNKALARVTNFSVVENVLTFVEVANATNYYVTVDCGSETHVHEAVEGKTFDFANCDMQAGGIKFTVTATADGYVSSVSDVFVVERSLASVTDVAVDANDNVTWTAVENATSYDVTITADGNTTTKTVTGTSFSLKDYNAGEITVSVKAKAFGYNSVEATSTTYTKARLAVPANLTLSNPTTVTWDAVAGATGYVVTVGTETYDVTTNSFEFTVDNTPTGVASVDVTVVAKGATAELNSFASSAYTIRFNAMADAVTYAAGEVAWAGVLNAKKYEVKVNDGNPFEVVGATKAPIIFTEAGVNTISVRCYAADDSVSDWVSTDVEVYELFMLGNGGVDAPTQYKATGDPVTMPESERRGYTQTGWYDKAVAGTKVSNSFTFEGNKTTIYYAGWTANTYTVSLYLSMDDAEPFDTVELTFGKSFTGLPTPVDPTNETNEFVGWYTEPNKGGTQFTNQKGNSIKDWDIASDYTLYAFWSEILAFEEITGEDGGVAYQVKAGRDIGEVTEVTIPAMFKGRPVTTVAANAFVGNNAVSVGRHIKKVNIPASIEYVELGVGGYEAAGSAFYGCDRLEEIVVYDVDIEGFRYEQYYSSYKGALIYHNPITKETELKYVPLKITEYDIPSNVTVIGRNVFYKSDITSLVIPATVKEIGDGAFYWCDMLSSLIFEEAEEGQSATLIISSHEDTFYGCSSLKSITLPSHIANTDFTALGRLTTLEEVIIENDTGKFYTVDGMVCTGTSTDAAIVFAPLSYKGNEGDGVLTIPDSIYKVAKNAFYLGFSSNTSLKTINISAHVTEIGEQAFMNCTAVTELNFLATKDATNAINIAKQAFYNLSTLTELELPKNMGTLEVNAFGSLTALTNVTIDVAETFAPVMNLKANAFATTANAFYVNTITIGEKTPFFTVTAPFGDYLAKVNVDKDNPYFDEKDGIIYSEGYETVVFVPMTMTGTNGAYTLPDEVKTISSKVFMGRKFSQLTIPAGVTTIGSEAFKNCKNLTSVVFLGTKTDEALTIGDSAFSGCTGLTSVTLPENLKTIGGNAFYGCTRLSNVTIPEGVTEIGGGLFANSTSLVSVTLPKSLTSISSTTAKVPMSYSSANVEITDYNIFKGCDNLAEINVTSGNTKFSVDKGVLYEAVEGGVKVLAVAPAYSTGTADEVLTLPNTVTEVASYAFYNLKNIKKIVFTSGENTTVTFGDRAFYYAPNKSTQLTEIELPTGTKRISREMFYNCYKVETVNVPYTVEVVDQQGFSTMPALSQIIWDETPVGKTPVALEFASLVVVNSSTDYLESTFFGCASLKTLELPERTTVIGDYVFLQGKSYAGYVESYISTTAVLECGIEKVVIPSTVTTIGNYAFARSGSSSSPSVNPYQSVNITEIEFAPNSKLASVGTGAFVFSAVKRIEFPNNEIVFGDSVFANARWLEYVKLPSKTTTVGKQTFYQTAGLETVEFYEDAPQLKLISEEMFYSSAIRRFVIPASVEEIGRASFWGAVRLESLTFAVDENGKSNLHTSAHGVFSHCTALTEIHFPETYELLTVGTNQFTNCGSLKTITFSSKMSDIGTMLHDAPALETVIIPVENVNIKEDDVMITNKNGDAIRFVYNDVEVDENGVYRIPDTITSILQGGFRGQGAIKTLIIPNTVTTIGTYAFANMANLETVIFEPGNEFIKTLPSYLFQDCPKLKNVTLPDHLETLGSSSYAFRNCTSLTGLTLPASMTSLGGYIFDGSGLTEITLPENLSFANTSTGAGAFSGAKYLHTVTFEGTVTALANNMFRDCASLTTINGIEDVTALGNNVFQRCTSLTSMDLSNVATIGNYAFDGCTGLTSVTLGDNLTALGGSATSAYVFQGCESLTEMTIPAGIKVIPAYLFKGCTGLTKVTFEGPVTELKNYVFQGCTNLTTVVGLDNVTKLNMYVFKDCSSLDNVALPSLTSISSYNFQNCTSLKNITLNPALTTLGGRTFSGCTSLTSIVLPEKLTKLNANEFEFSGLVSIVLPAGLVQIPNYAFQGCVDLVSVEAKGNLTTIGNYAFMNCTSFESINLSEFTTSIGNYAFQNCTSLETLEFPASLSSIGTQAFDGAGLTSVVLSTGLTTISRGAFANCANLASVTIDEKCNTLYVGDDGIVYNNAGDIIWAPTAATGVNGVFTYTVDTVLSAGAFWGNTSITKVVVEEGVTQIPTRAFQGMYGLTTVELPAGLEYIGDYAFEGCSALTTINIPSTVTTIATNVFANCTALEEIVLPEALMAIGKNTFNATGITSIVLPANVTAITEGLFANTTALTSLTINGKIRTVGKNAFNASALSGELSFPDIKMIAPNAFEGSNFTKLTFGNVETIGDKAFLNATQLKSVSFEDGAFYLGTENTSDSAGTGQVFMGCVSLTDVTLPSTLKFIRREAFRGCISLEEIDIPESVISLGNAYLGGPTSTTYNSQVFADCTSLKTVNFLGDDIKFILAETFLNCTALEEITFPASVGIICNSVFAGCTNLTSVTFEEGSQLAVLGDYVFDGCTNISELKLHSGIAIGASAFNGWTAEQKISFSGSDLRDKTRGWTSMSFDNCNAVVEL